MIDSIQGEVDLIIVLQSSANIWLNYAPVLFVCFFFVFFCFVLFFFFFGFGISYCNALKLVNKIIKMNLMLKMADSLPVQSKPSNNVNITVKM